MSTCTLDCNQGRDCTCGQHGFGLCQHADLDCAQAIEAARLGGGIVFVGEEPEFTRFDTLTSALAHLAGAVVALIVIAATAEYIYGLWSA